jgi:hypothetical protein
MVLTLDLTGDESCVSHHSLYAVEHNMQSNYRPVKTGFRFWAKAESASAVSEVEKLRD